MSLLSADCRQLVVEAALAGVNHSLLAEAHDIVNALPLLIPDPQVRLVCEAMLRFGLGDKVQARALLATSGKKTHRFCWVYCNKAWFRADKVK